jgi:C-terminal processing protease CtpA/Prc
MRTFLITTVLLGWQLCTGSAYAQDRLDGWCFSIGIQLGADPGGKIEIKEVIHIKSVGNAPLSPGLIVQKIDGTPTEGKSPMECAKMTIGAAGSKIKLEVIDRVHGETNSVELVRIRYKFEKAPPLLAVK